MRNAVTHVKHNLLVEFRVNLVIQDRQSHVDLLLEPLVLKWNRTKHHIDVLLLLHRCVGMSKCAIKGISLIFRNPFLVHRSLIRIVPKGNNSILMFKIIQKFWEMIHSSKTLRFNPYMVKIASLTYESFLKISKFKVNSKFLKINRTFFDPLFSANCSEFIPETFVRFSMNWSFWWLWARRCHFFSLSFLIKLLSWSSALLLFLCQTNFYIDISTKYVPFV